MLSPGGKFHDQSARGTFGDSLAELDWSIGTLMTTLRRLKVSEDIRCLSWQLSDFIPWNMAAWSSKYFASKKQTGAHAAGSADPAAIFAFESWQIWFYWSLTENKILFIFSSIPPPDPGQHAGDLHFRQRAQPGQARAGRLCRALQVSRSQKMLPVIGENITDNGARCLWIDVDIRAIPMFRCGKGTTWEGGMRVPGIISHKKLQPGVHSPVFSHMDLLPLSKHSYLFVSSAIF